MKEQTQAEVAYHEAGHCAVHIYHSLPFDKVTIIRGEGNLGSVQHPIITDPDSWDDWETDIDETHLLIDKHVSALFGGPVAQERYSGSNDGSGSDHNSIIEYASKRCSSGDEVDAYIAWIEICTRNLINMLWPQVKAIATALIESKELDAEAAKMVYRNVPMS